jgi:hypothetical protein
MASRETRARLVPLGDVSLGPLPQGQLAAGEVEAAREAVCNGEQVRRSVVRAGPQGTPEVSAAGDESPVALSQQVGEQGQRWTERRLGVRSVRQAHAAAGALRARVSKAMTQIAALNQRGRGKKRCEPVAA